MADRRVNFAKSAVRALDILELFGDLRRPVRAVEVAKFLGLPASSTDQVLKSMSGSGYLIFNRMAKTYFPSPRLIPFGCSLNDSFFGGTLPALLDRLHQTTGEVVSLSTISGDDIKLVDARAPDDYAGPTLSGLCVSVFASVLGRAFLGSLNQRELQHFVGRTHPIFRDNNGADYMRWVIAYRRQGYVSCDTSEYMPQYQPCWSIAVRVPPQLSAVPLMLGLSGPLKRTRAHDAEYGGLLRLSACELNSSLIPST